jgi:CheY-like chemotaxis protein
MDGNEVVSAGTLQEAAHEMARTPAHALLINDASVGHTLQRLHEAAILPPETPAIVCSIPEMREAAQSLAASDYLIKPVSQDRLLAALDRLQLKGNTVLVVDDEPEAARLYLRMFSLAGRSYRVLRATDGQQAMRILREQRPDVMLLDLVMPGMDGFSVLEARSEDPTLREIPAVVISARDPAGQPIVASALTATRANGLSIAQLLACIEGLIRTLSPVGLPADS